MRTGVSYVTDTSQLTADGRIALALLETELLQRVLDVGGDVDRAC